jgi:predicted ATPase
VEAGRAELAAMPGGVWLAELAPVTDPADVPQAVLAAMGLRERALVLAGRSAGAADEAEAPLDRLVSALGSKRALLVLDNCEHLLGAAAVLADRVLASCPQMRILATSREPLNITGEMLWPVGPLALPPDGPDPAPDEIAACASVRLLVQRARAARPGFEVTKANAAAVAGICRALDGMPLAIELAAARLRAMSPEQVASRLDDRFRLLTGGSRTAMPRHQTLRAVVDWSWDLLSDAERAVWRRFSVFTGGAGLSAAEQVCAGGPAPAVDVLDLLTALVE